MGSLLAIALFLWIIAWFVGSIKVTQRRDLSVGQKFIWILLFVFMPFVGLLIYYFVGRPKRTIYT